MIKFIVTEMISDSSTGIVKQINYTVKGNKGESTGGISLPEPGDDFIPFSELTPNIIQSWIEQLGLYHPEEIDDPDDTILTFFPWEINN
jgi:hypothetical protein